MNINAMMKLKNAWTTFTLAHPKFVSFISFISSTPLEEGTILSVSIKRPGSEKEIKSNLSVTKSDLELLELMKSMKN